MTDTIKLMKQSILDMAIRGKLVEQRPEEGTAEELILDIEKENHTILNNKKKDLPIITGIEKPYDIPDSWKWVRLNDVGVWGAGATPNRSNKSYWANGTMPWLKTGELNNSYITESDEKITESAIENTSVRVNKPGDILIAMYGATIGKLGILSIEATTNQACCACTPYRGINNLYLFYYLMAIKKEIINSSEGGAQPNISKTKIVKYLFPLPTLMEQNRIVNKIEETFAIIDMIAERREDTIQTLEKIRSTTIQEAIKGNLVKQNENDEPASELIKQINEEKEQLIKQKVIKKTKKLKEISKENEPFEIPESWEWVRLGEVIDLVSGRDLTKQEYNDTNNGIPYITGASNFSQNEILVNRWTQNPKVISKKGNLLITVKGTIGEMSIQSLDEAHIARQVMAIRNVHNLDIDYIQIFLQSQIIELTRKAKSMIPGISRNDLLNFEFPLPSRNEQTRIVNKVKSINRIIKEVEERLF